VSNDRPSSGSRWEPSASSSAAPPAQPAAATDAGGPADAAQDTVAVVTLLFGYHTSTSGPTPTVTQAVAPAAGGSTVTGAVAQTRLTLGDG